MAAGLDDQIAVQDRALRFLGGPATHGVAAVHRIDTHASIVFLAGDRALKVKRAIHLPYLDYSTLERRKAACEAELAINRPHAPQIYRQVVPITLEENGHLAIGGRGQPVEWALEMARFDEEQTLDKIALAGPIASELAIEIADAIVRSHGSAERSTARWMDSIPTLITRNTAKFRSVQNLPIEEINRIDALSLCAFTQLRASLEKRRADGFVRRCHGDLHLANITLIGGHPVLFDAIEFDPALATTDILYDLAFPLMDLIRFERDAAANIVLNRYLAATGKAAIDCLGALPLFMSIRAAIRANVLFTRYEQGHDDNALHNAQRYFAIAGELITPAAPQLIAVGGFSGTGKSVLARDLASEIRPRPGAVVLRSDVIRKRLFKVEDTAPLPPAAYHQSVSEDVYRTLTGMAARILAQGYSVIVDAAFLRETERRSIRKVAAEKGRTFCGLFLTADLATRLRRIKLRGNDASDATAEVAKLQEQHDIGALEDWMPVDASGSPQQTLQNSLAQLRWT